MPRPDYSADPGADGLLVSASASGGGGGGDGRSDGRSDGGSSGSNIAQAVLGAMLPATGGGYWLFLMILGALIMFFTGLFLRLHSGNSPGVTVA